MILWGEIASHANNEYPNRRHYMMIWSVNFNLNNNLCVHNVAMTKFSMAIVLNDNVYKPKRMGVCVCTAAIKLSQRANDN